MLFASKLWKGRKHYLDKMTLGELVRAYFAYPAIQVYIVLTLLAACGALYLMESPWPVLAAVAAVPIVYAPVWFLLHRYVLHGSWLYKSPKTAALWKRIHFDHHSDPNDLGVLFGALPTTLPTILLITGPVGGLIGGPAGALAAFAAGLVTTCFYEFCHCIQHLAYTPKLAFLKRIKKLHLAHHFRNENGNYGITNFFWDRLFGTYYPQPDKVAKSPTVFNLGYTGWETEQFPWVARLSGFEAGEREESEPVAPSS